MKKVGILTFHNAMSYGAVLQAYALQRTLTKEKCVTEIINYMNEDIYNAHVRILPKTKNWKFNLKMLIMGRRRYLWRKKLQGFRKDNLVESSELTQNELKKNGERYDLVIAGSDQVFNDICAGFDGTYFLDFVPDEKKYTYAASFGFKEIPTPLIQEYGKRLAGFQRLSIREESGCRIVSNLLNRNAECHIDPTFLLSSDEWDDIITASQYTEPYIFVFSVLKPVHMIEYALKLGREKGLRVLYLENYRFPRKKGLHYIGPVSPADFIGLIKNAEYIVTNSFHGMAFSIIYEKKFIVELNTNVSRNYRCADLLNKLGITGNELLDGKIDLDKVNYNWRYVNTVIDQEREKSKKYLREIIGKKDK